MSNITDEDYNEAMESLAQWEKEEAEKVRKILDIAKQKVSEDYFKGVEAYIDSYFYEGNVFGFEIVNKDIEEIETEEEFNNIKTSVNQTVNGGYTGDSYEGYVFVYLVDNECLRFNYSM